ncbi:hypothetical protein [Dehalococcoides sp. THU4]|uniref:hypothetical protein n=1 Tax=Dehalococcoides sp. THU4 TaxID=3348344 RepID=UPI003722BF04
MKTTIRITNKIQALTNTAIAKEGRFDLQMICFREGIAYSSNGYMLSLHKSSYLGSEPICLLASDIKALKIPAKSNGVLLDIDTEQGIAIPDNGQANIIVQKVTYCNVSHIFEAQKTRIRIVFNPDFMIKTLKAINPKSTQGDFNRCAMSIDSASSKIVLEHFINDPEPEGIGFIMPMCDPHLSSLDRSIQLFPILKDILTIDDFDAFGNNAMTSADANVDDGLLWAKQMLEKLPEAVVYTQCDNDNGNDECIYMRGFHLVNRTGVYAIIDNKPIKKD